VANKCVYGDHAYFDTFLSLVALNKGTLGDCRRSPYFMPHACISLVDFAMHPASRGRCPVRACSQSEELVPLKLYFLCVKCADLSTIAASSCHGTM
jgi:hypothetical protein